MEEDTMLLHALLGVEDQADLDYAAKQDPNSPKGKYSRLTPKQRKQVQAKLYDVLYKTIEYTYMPQNEELNMAIGETLARAISGQSGRPKNDPRIIREILGKAVTKAIDDEIEDS
jgi:hypothetical protein